jgi:hypothetical protein
MLLAILSWFLHLLAHCKYKKYDINMKVYFEFFCGAFDAERGPGMGHVAKRRPCEVKV